MQRLAEASVEQNVGCGIAEELRGDKQIVLSRSGETTVAIRAFVVRGEGANTPWRAVRCGFEPFGLAVRNGWLRAEERIHDGFGKVARSVLRLRGKEPKSFGIRNFDRYA